MVMAILFNHDSIFRNKKFLIPRLIRLVKSRNFKKLQEIYKENISGDFSHADDICSGLFKTNVIKKILINSYFLLIKGQISMYL